MYKVSDLNKNYYRPGEVAKILNVTTRTLRNYDYNGRIKFIRNDADRRILPRDDLISYMLKYNLIIDDRVETKRDVIYARVSSRDQKAHGDLDRQALYLIEHVPDLVSPMVFKEVGSGLNDKRPKLLSLIEMVCNEEVGRVYITYKDRLTRFGYHYLETVFKTHNVEIIVVKDKKEEKSMQMELVEDMMSLIASFSGKLYGMRSKKGTGKSEED